jgi:hypothetical protein
MPRGVCACVFPTAVRRPSSICGLWKDRLTFLYSAVELSPSQDHQPLSPEGLFVGRVALEYSSWTAVQWRHDTSRCYLRQENYVTFSKFIIVSLALIKLNYMFLISLKVTLYPNYCPVYITRTAPDRPSRMSRRAQVYSPAQRSRVYYHFF